MVIGAGLGALVYASRLTFAGIAPTLSAGPVVVTFLGAGVLGAAGRLVGALIHLYRTPRAVPTYEVRAVVPEDDRRGVGQTLIEAGAVECAAQGWRSSSGKWMAHGTPAGGPKASPLRKSATSRATINAASLEAARNRPAGG